MEPGHYREPGCQYQPQLVGQNHIMRKLFFTIFALQRDIVFPLFTAKLEETGSAWLIQLLFGQTSTLLIRSGRFGRDLPTTS